MKNGSVVDTVRIADVTPDEVLAMIILGRKPPRRLTMSARGMVWRRRSPAAFAAAPRCCCRRDRRPRGCRALDGDWELHGRRRRGALDCDGSGCPRAVHRRRRETARSSHCNRTAAARCVDGARNARGWSSRARCLPRRPGWRRADVDSSCCASARRCWMRGGRLPPERANERWAFQAATSGPPPSRRPGSTATRGSTLASRHLHRPRLPGVPGAAVTDNGV